MDLDQSLIDCNYYLKQIKHFNPDPYYVNYFFKKFLQTVNKVYDGIFEEARRDFGLYISGKCTKEKFLLAAMNKNDQISLKFLSWFDKKYQEEHQNQYPNFIKKILEHFNKFNNIPKIKLKMLSNKRYKDDIVHDMEISLIKGKIYSKEYLNVELRKLVPVFLDLINQKRKNYGEPKVSEKQIIVSDFLDFQNYEDFEITYACEIYLPVISRLLNESRNEIKKLTLWKE